jgi:hypothetical protein
MIKGFFAYSSVPSIMETIKEAINIINESNTIEITGWEDLRISGITLINVICSSIDKSEVFLADLTHLNPNVLFELGYAIAKNKRVMLFLDIGLEKSKINYEHFSLSTIGYNSYNNSRDITNCFFRDNPCLDIDKTPLSEMQNLNSNPINGMLYLKSSIDTQASLKLSHRINKSRIKPVTIDDPQEIRMQIHSWYIENTYRNYAFVGHLLSNDHSGKDLHNAKVSFAAGLAYGFGRKILMLAHEPYSCPLDYAHLLRKHSTAVECETYINHWLIEVDSYYLQDQKNDNKIMTEEKNISDLKNIDLGDYIAEQEVEKINDYFVETSAYREAFNSEYTLFVGRKGSGKSAILYRLENELSNDNRNHICVIKPVSYDLDGLIDILRAIEGEAEKGFLIESIWKYLIYTEMARSIYSVLESKPVYYEPREPELAIKRIVAENTDIFLDDFSSRLEQVINRFIKIDKVLKGLAYKKNVSEILHENLLSKLREILYRYFSEKNRIAVLVDNLDKNWKPGKNILYLSDFLLGLLSVTNRIADDFTYGPTKRKKTHFSIVIFLRMDIFSYIYKQARERDKLKYSILTWDDMELLLLLIEERFRISTKINNSSIIWDRYFPDIVEKMPINEYFIQNILPRPRDIIFFVKYALSNAITRKHNKIQENDILDAQQRYSQYAVDSLIVENGVSIDDFEKILYEFVGCARVISREDIKEAVERSGVKNIEIDSFIQTLCERCFLGRRIADNKYRYQTNFLDNEKIEILASHYIDNETDKIEYFEINRPFRKFLEIDND